MEEDSGKELTSHMAEIQNRPETKEVGLDVKCTDLKNLFVFN